MLKALFAGTDWPDLRRKAWHGSLLAASAWIAVNPKYAWLMPLVTALAGQSQSVGFPRPPKAAVPLLVLALLLTGCSGTASVIRAMAKDPATACITVTSIYGTVKVYRTAAVNATVSCSQDGMAVKSEGR